MVAGVILLVRRWVISDERVVGVRGLRDQGRVWVVSAPPSSWIILGVEADVRVVGYKGGGGKGE